MRNAKQILEASVKAIDDGAWICGELCTLKPSITGYENFKATDFMGCAIGLVSIYGGSARQSSWYAPDAEGVFRYVEGYVPEYPDVDAATAPILKAVKALALATPKKHQKSFDHFKTFDEYDEMEKLTNIITNYNDINLGRLKTKAGRENQARKWFLKAIDLLPTLDGKLTPSANVEALDSLSAAF